MVRMMVLLYLVMYYILLCAVYDYSNQPYFLVFVNGCIPVFQSFSKAVT